MLLFCFRKLFKALVSEVKNCVNKNHEEVQEIEYKDVSLGPEIVYIIHGGFSNELTDNACNITEENEEQEQNTLTLC